MTRGRSSMRLSNTGAARRSSGWLSSLVVGATAIGALTLAGCGTSPERSSQAVSAGGSSNASSSSSSSSSSSLPHQTSPPPEQDATGTYEPRDTVLRSILSQEPGATKSAIKLAPYSEVWKALETRGFRNDNADPNYTPVNPTSKVYVVALSGTVFVSGAHNLNNWVVDLVNPVSGAIISSAGQNSGQWPPFFDGLSDSNQTHS